MLKEGNRQLNNQFVETLDRMFPDNPYRGLTLCPCCDALFLVDAFEALARNLIVSPSSPDRAVMLFRVLGIMSEERDCHESVVVRQLEKGEPKAKERLMALLDMQYPGHEFELAHCESCGVHHLMTTEEVRQARCVAPKIPKDVHKKEGPGSTE